MPATVDVTITAVAASTKAVDAIEVESLVGDWGFEVGAEKVYFSLSPPPEQWMQKRLRLWLDIGDLKSLGALGALWELVAVVHILNCAQVSFDHFELNCDVWLLVRTYCRGLLGSEELKRYRELYDESNEDENRQSEWAELLKEFDPEDEFVSVYESRYDIDDD